jgi:hypothetical protein
VIRGYNQPRLRAITNNMSRIFMTIGTLECTSNVVDNLRADLARAVRKHGS